MRDIRAIPMLHRLCRFEITNLKLSFSTYKVTTSEVTTVSAATAQNSAIINAVISLSVLCVLLIIAFILMVLRNIRFGRKIK